MIKIAAVDDNNEFLKEIHDFIGTCLPKDEFSIDLYNNPTIFLSTFHCQYDIVFLDIEMPGIDGLSAAKDIRKVDENVIIIFITNFGSLAIKGFEVEAFDFIVKPIQPKAFADSLTRAYNALKKRSGDFLLFEDKDGIRKIHTRDILYVESVKHYLVFHLVSEVIQERGLISDLEKKIGQFGFARCNNGCLVNLKYVDRVSNNLVYVLSQPLTLSRGKKKAFIDALTRNVI